MEVIFDIGGTKIKVMLIDEGRLVEDRIHPSNNKILEIIKKILIKYDKDHHIEGVFYSVAGQIKNDKVVKSPNLKALNGVDLREYTHSVITKPIKINVANDANCFALGAYHLLNEKPYSLLGVVWGTGIGGGIVVNGKVLEGSKGIAGEIGHIKLNHDYLCGCGKRGCLEAIIGGRGLEQRHRISVKNFMSNDENTFIKETVEWLAMGLEKAIHLFDPEIIAIGGSIGENLSSEYLKILNVKLNKLLSFNNEIVIKKINTFEAVIKGCENYIRM